MGKIEIAQLLLEYGADPNAKNGTFLFVYKMLSNYHAIRSFDKRPYYTPIFYVKSKVELLKLLLKYNADINDDNNAFLIPLQKNKVLLNLKITPLLHAAENYTKYKSIIKHLLEYGANPLSKNNIYIKNQYS